MLGKLTWVRYGLVIFTGLLSACSQEAQNPEDVGATQVELRSDLVLPEPPSASSKLLDEENSGDPTQSTNSIPATQRISLSELGTYSEGRAYRDVQRYEFLPALLKEPKTRKSSGREGNTHASSWTLADKHWVRAGKGFGVAAEEMTVPGVVHVNDAPYYFPAIASNSTYKASEHLAPADEPFKSHKPLVFHSRATGFVHEPAADVAPSEHSPGFETRLELSPIPETQVYFSSQPKTKVTLSPAEHSLDLMNGNENLNRDRYQKLP